MKSTATCGSFGPLLLYQLELHRERWTPEITQGTKLRSPLGFRYEVVKVDGENVHLKRLGVVSTRFRPRQRIFQTTISAVKKRLIVE